VLTVLWNKIKNKKHTFLVSEENFYDSSYVFFHFLCIQVFVLRKHPDHVFECENRNFYKILLNSLHSFGVINYLFFERQIFYFRVLFVLLMFVV